MVTIGEGVVGDGVETTVGELMIIVGVDTDAVGLVVDTEVIIGRIADGATDGENEIEGVDEGSCEEGEEDGKEDGKDVEGVEDVGDGDDER